MFVPSYLFLDFVFVLFPTLGWRKSQHSLVWTPTSSHQYLLKAQSKPAAPAGIWFSKEVLMQPLHPHTPGIGRRPVSTALGLTGEDFLLIGPMVIPRRLRPSCGACFPSALRTSSPAPSHPPLWSSRLAPHLCTSTQGKPENPAELEAYMERGEYVLLLAGYCLWWRQMCWKNWSDLLSDLPPSPIFTFPLFLHHNLVMCRSLTITQKILTK